MYPGFSNETPANNQAVKNVEALRKQKREDDQLRLARIQNGADPAHKNGKK